MAEDLQRREGGGSTISQAVRISMRWRRVLDGGDGGGGREVEGHENAMATSFSFPIWYGISGNELMKGD